MTRPTVTLIFTSDDHGFPYYGFMEPYASLAPVGHPKVLTPRLDALAARGALFPYATSTAPKCEHAFQGELVGKEALDQIKGGTNNLDLSQEWTWARILRDVGGYSDVMQCGKYWEGDVLGGGGFTDEYDSGATADHFGRETVQPALDFLTAAVTAGRPCALSAAPRIPHLPFPTPTFPGYATYRALYDTMDWSTEWLAGWQSTTWAHNFYGMVSWVDAIYGALEDHLLTLGVLDDTLILFWSDNGFGLKESKDTDTHNGRATPIIAAYPAAFGPCVSERIVSCIDFLPTILDYAEVVSPTAPLIDALSMRALCESGGTTPWRLWKPGQWTISAGRHAYASDFVRADSTVTRGILYTDNHNVAKRVYDLGNDTEEAHNLIATPAGQAFAAKYTPLLRDWEVSRVPPAIG